MKLFYYASGPVTPLRLAAIAARGNGESHDIKLEQAFPSFIQNNCHFMYCDQISVGKIFSYAFTQMDRTYRHVGLPSKFCFMDSKPFIYAEVHHAAYLIVD